MGKKDYFLACGYGKAAMKTVHVGLSTNRLFGEHIYLRFLRTAIQPWPQETRPSLRNPQALPFPLHAFALNKHWKANIRETKNLPKTAIESMEGTLLHPRFREFPSLRVDPAESPQEKS